GVRKALAELGNLCLAQELALRLRRALELAAVNNVDRAFRSHHRDFSSGPGVIRVGADMLAGHDAVGAAVGLARDDRDFRDGGFGAGIEQLRSVLNDAAELLLRAGQKTGHVLEGDQGNIERIAEAYKARALHRSVDV